MVCPEVQKGAAMRGLCLILFAACAVFVSGGPVSAADGAFTTAGAKVIDNGQSRTDAAITCQGTAFPGKGFRHLVCCLFMVSGLTAQATSDMASSAPNDPPPQTDGAKPNDRPQIPIEMWPELLKGLEVKAPHVEELEKQRKDMDEALRWISWIVGGILAALGGWGTSQALRKTPVPAPDTAKTHTEELGLGVDGKDGVWIREVLPWEK
jgi:hypothetical protein